jgi:hypothetical protein
VFSKYLVLVEVVEELVVVVVWVVVCVSPLTVLDGIC